MSDRDLFVPKLYCGVLNKRGVSEWLSVPSVLRLKNGVKEQYSTEDSVGDTAK